VARTFAALVEEQGGELRLGTKVEDIYESRGGVDIATDNGDFRGRTLINCAGLYSDRLASLSGLQTGLKIVPFRGEYYELRPERRHLVRNLIYPVPNPDFPFLGVHFTRAIDGSVEAGPNAVLGLSREGYKKTDISPKDVSEMLSYPAFWRLVAKNWRVGVGELGRSLSKQAFVGSLQKLVPEIREDDLIAAPAGVRAQALAQDGKLMDDFVILEGISSVHVCNAPSPAATACIPIGETIAERTLNRKRHEDT
jgi:L-2-hydroxyglutarate oxidase